ncbi:hypothetical protein HZC09_02395 [Candidatus Micrarchaeota archaeon]|nr:hypothetical protein [Candidatus Micrarchaeota archaeon]
MDAKTVGEAIRKEMPHLDFVVWDLAPLKPYLHYWRKNIVFIECEKIAARVLAECLSARPDFSKAHFFLGVRRPKRLSSLDRPEHDFNVVILARAREKEPELEEKIAELILFSFNGSIPMRLGDVLGAVALCFEGKKASIPKFHKYMTERYLGWFANIVLYKFSKRFKIEGIRGPHIERGKRNLVAIKEVDEFE